MTLGDIAERVKEQIISKQQEDAEKSAQEQRYAELKDQQIRDQKAYEQRLRDAEKSKAEQEKEDRERARKLKETEDEIKAQRHRQEEAEKTAQFKAMAAKNEARKAKDAEDEAILRDRKHTANERIEARRRMEQRQKEELAAREPAKPPKEYTIKGFGGKEHKIRMETKGGITPETIKASIKKTVSKAPAKIEAVTTGVFGGILDASYKPKPQYNAKWLKQEQGQLSKAVKMHEPKPTTGGKVRSVLKTPVVRGSTAVFVKPGYVESLLGSNKPIGKKQKSGALSGLDDFVRRL